MKLHISSATAFYKVNKYFNASIKYTSKVVCMHYRNKFTWTNSNTDFINTFISLYYYDCQVDILYPIDEITTKFYAKGNSKEAIGFVPIW